MEKEYGKETQVDRPIKIQNQNSKRANALSHDWKEPVNPAFSGFAADQLNGFPKGGVTPKMPNKM
jgi:hypothetical protein